MRKLSFVIGVAVVSLAIQVGAQDRRSRLADEPACQTLTLASTGGPMPKNPAVAVLRWLGTSSHELAFRDSVILLDAYYDRPPRARRLGFDWRQINRVTAILIGHGHTDHMAEAPAIAARTGSPVIGGPPTIKQALSMGLPAKQAISVRGGEIQEFKGFTIEAILAHHSVRTPEFLEKVRGGLAAMNEAAYGPLTEADKKHAEQIRGRGTSDPSVATEGTIAYLLTFANRFRLLWLDSAGPITEGERRVMQRIGRTDVALVAYQGHYLPIRQIEATLPLVKLFNPSIFLPTHHDAGTTSHVDMAGYPLFMAIRDELPKTKSISPMYRTPVCIDTATKEVFVGP